jgi:hypothetical protein
MFIIKPTNKWPEFVKKRDTLALLLFSGEYPTKVLTVLSNDKL